MKFNHEKWGRGAVPQKVEMLAKFCRQPAKMIYTINMQNSKRKLLAYFSAGRKSG
jgi:hypothetical protein